MTSKPSPRLLLLLVVATTVCGCQLRPHVQQPPFPTGPAPGVAPDQRRIPNTASRGAGPEVRRACRVSNLSSDWVELDYTVSSECAAVEGERYNGALVARHADYPRGTELMVCADQRVPNGWRRGATVEDVAFQSLCQSTLRVRTIAERVMRIYLPSP